MSGNLFVEERRRVILEQLREQGRVSVNDLSELLHVSAVTIRYDLRSLEEEGLLERTYGGAVLPANQPSPLEMTFEVRQRRSGGEKEAIARTAAGMVQNGYSIGLDASTTAYAMVPYLKQLDRLIVVTNSLMIAQSFLDSPQVHVFMPGGGLRRDSISLVGSPETMPDINLNMGFFGAHGISTAMGITDIDPDEVAMKRALRARCMTTVIIAHHEKWDKVAPYPFAELSQVDTIITSQRLTDVQTSRLREQKIRIVNVAV